MAKRKDKPFIKKYKPVIVNDVEYPSIKHAIESLGIKHRATFYDKVKRGIIKLDYK
jgi:acetoacetate decarboxylase